MYSIGYTADEIAEIVEAVNWDQILTNKIPLDKVTFEEKAYYGRYLLDFYLKGKELQFPSGVIEGQALMELVSKLTRPVHNITDFNNLPIPFACIGTNIVTGEKVVLNKGSLAKAMRASMAIPTVFTPMKIDDNLLVDGGLVRNMPVPEVLDMGADIVIGVFVGSDLTPEDELKSLVSILAQSALINGVFDAREQIKKCDILIQPDLKGFSTASFHSSSEILERGNEAGQQYVEVFRHLADSLKQFGALHKVIKPEIQDNYTFQQIEIEGNKNINDDFIIGKLNFKPGKVMSDEELESRLNLIFGTQYFKSIQYEILGEKDNQTLKIIVVERPNIHFRFSYHYDSENNGGIIGNVTFRNVLLKSSRLIFEADMSAQPTVFMDYFKYMGKKQNYALALSGILSNKDFPLYDSTSVVNSIFSSTYYEGSFRLQSTNLRNSTYGLEASWSDMNLNAKITEETIRPISIIKYKSTTFGAFYKFNNLNQRYFPTKGMYANVEFTVTPKINGKITIYDVEIDAKELGDLLQTSTIKSLNIVIAPIFKTTPKLSILTKARMKLSNVMDNTLNVTEFDFVGGFTPDLANSNEYYGAGIKEYGLANYFYGKAGLQYELFRNLFLQANFNYLSTEYPVTFFYPNADIGKLGDRNSRFGYSGLVGFMSPVGPISFAVAKDHFRKDWKASLVVGFRY